MNIIIRKPLGFSEVGKKDNQEDYLWPELETVTADNRVFLMCDGMGGHDSGEVASQTAATALGEYITNHTAPDGIVNKAMFEEALAYAYDELDKVDTMAVKKMGTTMTCVVLHNDGALLAHIGDSRIYHIRPLNDGSDKLKDIIYQTSDHALVNDLIKAGELTEEEADHFPQKNVITRAMQPHLERRFKADIHNLTDIKAGDYFFLCSDGVLEQLSNANLCAILSNPDMDDSEKLQAIKNVCFGRTRDNYTCWLIPVDSVENGNNGTTDNDELEVSVVADDEATQPIGINPPAQPSEILVEARQETEAEIKEMNKDGGFFAFIKRILKKTFLGRSLNT